MLTLYVLQQMVVGLLFAAFVFCIGAFSLPMIIDRKAGMLVWVLLIVPAVAAGITAFIGLAVTLPLPLIGYATWYAYQENIDSSAWLRHPGYDG